MDSLTSLVWVFIYVQNVLNAEIWNEHEIESERIRCMYNVVLVVWQYIYSLCACQWSSIVGRQSQLIVNVYSWIRTNRFSALKLPKYVYYIYCVGLELELSSWMFIFEEFCKRLISLMSIYLSLSFFLSLFLSLCSLSESVLFSETGEVQTNLHL